VSDDGIPCDDGDGTTSNDLCVLGICAGTTNCLTESDCRDAAEVAGLAIGGGGFEFAGEYLEFSCYGCFAFSTGSLAGTAFFSTGGTAWQMSKPITITDSSAEYGVQFRPQCGPAEEGTGSVPTLWNFFV
jgi:hypothetical protein